MSKLTHPKTVDNSYCTQDFPQAYSRCWPNIYSSILLQCHAPLVFFYLPITLFCDAALASAALAASPHSEFIEFCNILPGRYCFWELWRSWWARPLLFLFGHLCLVLIIAVYKIVVYGLLGFTWGQITIPKIFQFNLSSERDIDRDCGA
mmetsp:Transcript_28955/g.61178  ORF Transcript_28955/g.61178 Transcript_28955/m.61178 type:complete len:149 (-) Transcript_28955:214-660(-)